MQAALGMGGRNHAGPAVPLLDGEARDAWAILQYGSLLRSIWLGNPCRTGGDAPQAQAV